VSSGRLGSERGTTLLETAVASAILLIVLAGLLSMGAVATSITENDGHLAARTAESAQDKMEQLLSLKFGDEQSDTTRTWRTRWRRPRPDPTCSARSRGRSTSRPNLVITDN
jgi:hypothetical protein